MYMYRPSSRKRLKGKNKVLCLRVRGGGDGVKILVRRYMASRGSGGMHL